MAELVCKQEVMTTGMLSTAYRVGFCICIFKFKPFAERLSGREIEGPKVMMGEPTSLM